MELRLEIRGLDELVAKLAAAADAGVFTAAHRVVAEEVDQAAKARADTRQMRRAVMSNQIKVVRKGPQIKIGGGSGDREWAVGAQYGAVRYKQFPSFAIDGYTVEPAIDDSMERIKEIYAEAVLKNF